jgi:hypothetical protein
VVFIDANFAGTAQQCDWIHSVPLSAIVLAPCLFYSEFESSGSNIDLAATMQLAELPERT